MNEIKTSLENCGNERSSYLIFSNTPWCSFPNGSVWLELVESATGRVVLLQLSSYERWSSRYDGLRCHATMTQTTARRDEIHLSVGIWGVLY